MTEPTRRNYPRHAYSLGAAAESLLDESPLSDIASP